jgi:heat shock protein HtpX
VNLFEQQHENRRRSALLVAVFVLFFAWVGFGGDWAFWLLTQDAAPGAYRHGFPWIGFVACAVAAGSAAYAWHHGPERVLWATGAWEVIEPATDDQRRLVNVVEEMAIAAGLPRPRIWVVLDDDPNAFATGMSADRSHVAVTEGLLRRLSRDELQAVVAHEMAHVRNYDVRLMTLLAALVGVLALVSDGVMRSLRFGGRGGGRGFKGGGGKKGGGGALIVILLVIWLISVILAPVVSRLLALGVSRKRELLADATGAQFTRNPGALASALQKIEQSAAPTKAIHRGSAHLCIADPLGRRLTNKQGFVADLLATHPPMAVRIARLKQMAYQFEKTGELTEPVA